MVIFSFGSGFQLESSDPEYFAKVKANVAKAQSKGIEVGAYDLIGWSRNSNAAVPGSMALAPDGHTLAAGACWASGWRDFLTDHVNKMGNLTGLSMIETDGPYGGYSCSNASHVHHHGEGDSVYMQVRGQGDFYRELRNKGFFINAPDDYFFQGSNKEGVGYNENQFSLPRLEQACCSSITLPCIRFLFFALGVLSCAYIAIAADDHSGDPLRGHLHHAADRRLVLRATGRLPCRGRGRIVLAALAGEWL